MAGEWKLVEQRLVIRVEARITGRCLVRQIWICASQSRRQQLEEEEISMVKGGARGIGIETTPRARRCLLSGQRRGFQQLWNIPLRQVSAAFFNRNSILRMTDQHLHVPLLCPVTLVVQSLLLEIAHICHQERTLIPPFSTRRMKDFRHISNTFHKSFNIKWIS